MDKFRTIDGIVGQNKYSESFKQTINVDGLTDDDICSLENMGYSKDYRWISKDYWESVVEFKNGKIDPEKIEQKKKKGLTLKKEMYKMKNIPIKDCMWIDHVILNDKLTGYKEMTFFFLYDRYSELDLQKKILTQNTFITYKDVLNFVDEFYNGVLSDDELAKFEKLDDPFGYADLAKSALRNNTHLQRKCVIGERNHFDHFIPINGLGYKLLLSDF